VTQHDQSKQLSHHGAAFTNAGAQNKGARQIIFALTADFQSK
jgi:predicted secreted Zn-dependent protease